MTVVKRTRKKKSSRQYFTLDTEAAIIQYNDSDDNNFKNRIYAKEIYPALDKLVENLIHRYKFYYFEEGSSYEDCKHDVVVFLTEKLDKFTEGKGKAYSYFTRVGINFLILNNTKNYKSKKAKHDLELVDEERDLLLEVSRENYVESLSGFMDEWIDKIDGNLETLFPSKKDQAIVDSLLELFRTRKSLESFNKKTLYILVRERTGIKTQKITKIVNYLKRDFYHNYEKYIDQP